MAKGIPTHNPEGYRDPTTHEALTNVMNDYQKGLSKGIHEADQRNNALIKSIRSLVDLAGFDLLSRIEVKDRKTGRTYK